MTPRQRRLGVERPVPGEIDVPERALHELSIEERGTFGPELRSALVKEYGRLRRAGGRSSASRRLWWACAGFVLAIVGVLSIPRTRSALFQPFHTDASGVRGSVDGAGSPGVGSAPNRIGAFALSPRLPAEGFVAVDSALATLPVLADRMTARRIVAEEYPRELQERGVGGTVRILAWINPQGGAELVQIDGSSGMAELDQAAVRVARALRFQPATRLGVAVGTWLAVPIRFMPNAAEVGVAPRLEAPQIPLSN